MASEIKGPRPLLCMQSLTHFGEDLRHVASDVCYQENHHPGLGRHCLVGGIVCFSVLKFVCVCLSTFLVLVKQVLNIKRLEKIEPFFPIERKKNHP